MRIAITALLAGLFMFAAASPAVALDDDHWKQADQSIERGIEFLRKTQNEDGSWSPKPGPAVTALVVRVLLDEPDISVNDPAVKNGLDYIMSKVKEDGGIHDGFLENYNTAICLSALSRVNTREDVARAIEKAQQYLIKLQWNGQEGPGGKSVDEDHAFFGGAGYGGHGRPDMSNTQMMLEGLYDSGLDCNDPAFKRAMVFISRCQGTESNTKYGDRIVPDGGFIYATSPDKDHVGELESKAGVVTYTAPDGTQSQRLGTYGSITYAGFKSYIYANLDRDDPRVVDAYKWITKNYTLTHNPGLPEAQKLQGHYYYLMTFARAMDAWGSSTVKTADGKEHDWANDVIAQLTSMQREDGSWTNEADRWMEGDANMVTAFALIALQHAK